MADLSAFFANPLFGVTLSVGAMVSFHLLFRNAKSSLLNPMIFSIITIIAFLKLTGIPYESYANGGRVLSFFLGPAIVSLAVPLYKQFDKLKQNALPILLGISLGVVVSIASGLGLSLLFGLNRELAVSMAPKGATSAISMDLARSLGGDPSMTVAFVNVAGIFGYMIGEKFLNLLRITSPVARGVSLGTASHAMGTKRAFDMGEEEGAMASLSIGLAGVLTSFLMPAMVRLFGL